MASSSTSIYKYTHDVFLSFRGADTRYTFTGHLHRALLDKGIYVFIDYELERGEEITPQLLKVIKESKISIVVLSKCYASSSFYLDELVKILECKESKRQFVIPVFYHVDPTDVEEQTGAFGQEFSIIEAQFDKSEIQRAWNWRSALTKVATLSGYHLKEGDHEANAIQNIVKEVSTRLHHVTALHVGENLIGLDYHVEYIHQEFKIKSDDTFMLGLYGMGGIGKTTLAKALFNKWATQFEFDGCCFLENVRENASKHGLAQLQQKLLHEILRDQNLNAGNSDKGIEVIKHRLSCKKVLILIDDVDNIEQLQKLAGDIEWFGAGSKIIITTRNSRLLEQHDVTMIYEVQILKHDLAIKLFSWHAFRELQPREGYIELTYRAIGYAQGLPLALKLLGSSLYKESVEYWDEILEKLGQCRDDEINEKIFNVLEVSYDSLDREEKIIFLDIAFFFKEKTKDTIVKFLDGCGFSGFTGVQKLIKKSLLYVNTTYEEVWMHDLLQEMGTRIAFKNFSRLCIRKGENISSMSLEDKRAYDVEILVLDLDGEEEVPLKWLQSLSNLRVLAIRNGRFIKMPKKLPNSIRWLECRNNSVTSIPSKFLPHNLFALEMHCSSMKAFITDMPKAQKFINLSRLDLSHSLHLRKIVVDFSSIPNIEVLDLRRCENLKKIHKSIGSLEKLERLKLKGCCSLTSLPNLDKNKCLEVIDLTSCSKFEKLPNLPITITQLQLTSSGIKEIPLFIGNLINLHYIEASNCKNLLSVSNSIYMLPHVSIELANCPKLTQFPEFQSSMVSLAPFSQLEHLLVLSGNKFVSLPKNTLKFTHFSELDLSDCKWLVEIPELPHTLQSLGARNCKLLVRFSQFQFVRNFKGYFNNCHNILGENEKKRWREMIEEKWRIKRNEVPLLRSYEITVPGNEIPEGFSYNFNWDDTDCHSFQLPSSMFNPNLIAIAFYAIFQPPFNNSEIIFSMNELTIFSAYLIAPIESEHTWLAFRYYDFALPKLSEAEEISCKFCCEEVFGGIVVELKIVRVGVHLIYKN